MTERSEVTMSTARSERSEESIIVSPPKAALR